MKIAIQLALCIALALSSLGSVAAAPELAQIRLALKYVVFEDVEGQNALNASDAAKSVALANSIWKPCRIQFTIEEFRSVMPGGYGIGYRLRNYGDLNRVRKVFEDPSTLLVVTTGPWERNGSLGQTTANAWTSMPGAGPFGIVVEQPVSHHAGLIAHELGHYLGLSHSDKIGSLMNPVIYPGSTEISPAQCDIARSTIEHFWSQMRR